jgi:hypothetical protein
MSAYIGSRFILRYSTIFGAVLLGACAVAYFLLYGILTVQLGSSFSDAFYALKSLYERMGLLVWFAVVLYGICAAVLILVTAMFATHKVAGPLFRLEMMIDEAMRGKIPRSVHFREEDQIKPLAEAQAWMFAAMAAREDAIAALTQTVAERRAALTGLVHETPERWAQGVEALGDALGRLAEATGTTGPGAT